MSVLATTSMVKAVAVKHVDLDSDDEGSKHDAEIATTFTASKRTPTAPVSEDDSTFVCSKSDSVKRVWGALDGRAGTVHGWSTVGVQITFMFATLMQELEDEEPEEKQWRKVGSRLARVFEKEVQFSEGREDTCHGDACTEETPAGIPTWQGIQTLLDMTAVSPPKYIHLHDGGAGDDDADDVSTQDADTASVSDASGSTEGMSSSECADTLDELGCMDHGWAKVGVQMKILFSNLAAEADDESSEQVHYPR